MIPTVYGAVTEKSVQATIPEPRQANPPARRSRTMSWIFGLVIAALLIAVPTVYHRYTYTHSKRLREVAPGKLYRAGSMTAPGFRAAIERYGIKTIINLMDEAPDPALRANYLGLGSERESALCKERGVRYVNFRADLVNRADFPARRPEAIDAFLRIMDDPSNYPVLVHCRAGLHRTGCLMAVYRMEYDGWSKDEALRELRNMGFGHFFSTSANDYIVQYILGYERGLRRGSPVSGVASQPGSPGGNSKDQFKALLGPVSSHGPRLQSVADPDF
jgi:tyrosine-protein phosphatase SIW14